MISARSIYENAVVQPLLRLEQKKVGEIFELNDGVIGFTTGKAPRILVTACHHASEIYGTYDAILEFLESTVHEVTAIPVVDVANFCYYKKKSSEYLSNNYDECWQVCFINDSIMGYKGIKPRTLEWQYGDSGAIQVIEKIARIIDTCDLVIDVHNTCTNRYSVITSLINRRINKRSDVEYIRTVVGKIVEIDGIHKGDLGVKFKKLDEGLFECLNEKSITSYAAKKGVTNLALETPVFSESQSLRNLDQLSKLNGFLLEYSIDQYNMIYRTK